MVNFIITLHLTPLPRPLADGKRLPPREVKAPLGTGIPAALPRPFNLETVEREDAGGFSTNSVSVLMKVVSLSAAMLP